MKNLQEKAKDIKIVFFDIDDTLRTKDTGFMPESAHLAFEALRVKGIMTGIATGRNFAGILPEIIALKPDVFVTINGAYVEKADGRALLKNNFSNELIEEVIDWLKAENSEYAFVGRDQVMVSTEDSIAYQPIKVVYNDLPTDADYYKENAVYQMLTMGEDDRKLTVPEHLADKVRMVRWHDYSSDIVPIAGSKADGVQKVLDELGFNPENAMNFGDGLNDMELFEFAGLSVAMKVSHPELLKKADYITDSVENDGIYKALEVLELI